MKLLLIFSLIIGTSAFAQDDIERDNVEGKVQAVEVQWLKDLDKGIGEKQQKALALLTMVATKANSASRDEEAEYAHVGFAARFQGIREDRENLARKEIAPDYATIQNYSKRLDSLIKDLQAFLK